MINHKTVSRIMRENGLQVRPLRRLYEPPTAIMTARSFQTWRGTSSPADPTKCGSPISHTWRLPPASSISPLSWTPGRAEWWAMGSRGGSTAGWLWQLCEPRSSAASHLGLHPSLRSRNPVCLGGISQGPGPHGLVGSMGRRGNPYDNAKAESFMKTLKCEEVYLNDYRTFIRRCRAASALHRRGIQHAKTALGTGLSFTRAVRGTTRPQPGPISRLTPVQPKGFTPRSEHRWVNFQSALTWSSSGP